MIGLIKKDFMMVKKQLLIVVALMAFYCIVLGNGRTADYQIGLFSGYLVAFMAVLPISMLAYDEKNKWGKYAAALPVSRNQQVISKYIILMVLVLIAIIVFVALVFITGTSFANISTQLAITFSTALIMSSIIMALAYKFGTSKARFVFFGMIFVIMLVMAKSMTGNTDINMEQQFVKPHGFEIMCITFGLLIYIASCCISMYLFSKKDL